MALREGIGWIDIARLLFPALQKERSDIEGTFVSRR
jgi:hypothetical protein